MKVGLVDVDQYTTHYSGSKAPNLPLMKLAAYHKAKGDMVEPWLPLSHYDVVYKSKVFSNDRDIPTPIYADKIIQGGTGYDIKMNLPEEIEHAYPEYSLYNITDTAHGFLTRGCPRACPFCIVAEKEGRKSIQVADIGEFWRGQKNIQLYDPNIMACRDAEKLLLKLAETKATVDFNQGLDIRFITPEKIDILNQIKTRIIHFAWDDPHEDLVDDFIRFQQRWACKDTKHYTQVYVLCNFKSTFEEDQYRVETLRRLGYSPYVMVYDREHAPRISKQYQRYVNHKGIFYSITWNAYKNKDKNNGR